MKACYATLIVLGLQLLALTAADKDEAKVLFEDKFDSKLAKEWSWVREDSKAWQIAKDGLAIRAQSESGAAQKNVLRLPARSADEKLIIEVFVDFKASAEGEYAGVKCYWDDENWVWLGKEEYADGIQLTRRKQAEKPGWYSVRYQPQSVWLRMVLSGGTASGWYRPTAKDSWKKLAECALPGKGEMRIELGAGGGPKDAEHWARFQHFRILKPAT